MGLTTLLFSPDLSLKSRRLCNLSITNSLLVSVSLVTVWVNEKDEGRQEEREKTGVIFVNM